jgi:hypothetical protein
VRLFRRFLKKIKAFFAVQGSGRKRKMSSKLRRWPLHPLVAAVYPVLALLANNISQVKASAALRPLFLVVFAALLFWGLLLLLLRDVRRSAMLASWWLALFFAYGHVYNFLEAHIALGRHRFLLPLWIMLAWFSWSSCAKLKPHLCHAGIE